MKKFDELRNVHISNASKVIIGKCRDITAKNITVTKECNVAHESATISGRCESRINREAPSDEPLINVRADKSDGIEKNVPTELNDCMISTDGVVQLSEARDVIVDDSIPVVVGKARLVALEDAPSNGRKTQDTLQHTTKAKKYDGVNKLNKIESMMGDIREDEEEEIEEEVHNTDLGNIDIDDKVLAAIVVADVIGLFTEDNPEYHRDREILVDQYPELKEVLRKSNSVEDAITLARHYDNIEFTDRQIELMKSFEGKVEEPDEVDFNELVY